MVRASMLGILLAIGAAGVAGQTRSPDSFGTDDGGFTVIGFDDFLPVDAADGWTGGAGANSRSSPGVLLAGTNGIPNGAFVTSVILYVHDVDPAEDVEAELCSSSWEIVSGEAGLLDCTLGGIGGVSTSGTPGSTTLGMSVDRRILFQEAEPGIDPVGNHFFLRVRAPGPLTSIHMARLHWRRQVRPEPPAATFGDVPTDHPFFQFVEALSLSGITAGCGSGNYCPDAPLTRGQMAVFLAKALGLHWPWENVVAARARAMR